VSKSRLLAFVDVMHGAVVGTVLAIGGLRRPSAPMTTAERLAAVPRDGLPLTGPAEIHWNEHQIPFIEAGTDEDLAVALGVVHAHLRLGQIEIMRRIAQGRVAEMVGPLGIEIDRSLRLMELGRAVPEIIAGLAPDTRRWAEAFVRGFNHALLTTAVLPDEFAVLGIAREPWTLTDLFTLARLSSADISWLIWVRLLRVRRRLGRQAWRALWPRLVAGGAPAAFVGTQAGAEQALAAATRSGSNSAAVSARRSASGAAMIASDPHLPLGLPNPWLIAGMKSPSYHAVGLMMPGLPFIALGRNPSIAWGGTSLHAQSSDLFDLSTLPPDSIVERTETIRVRGGFRRKLRLRASPLGPVVSDGLLLRSPGPTALRWVGHRPSDEIGAMLGVARASDWTSFRAALAGFGVSGLNMVFASGDGRVGSCLAAHLPRRKMAAPDDLIQPAEAAGDWSEIADGDLLPAQVDPPEGFVVSANERPIGSDFPVGFFFAPNDRAARIAALLGGDGRLSAEALERLQQDVQMPGALKLRDLLLAQLGDGRMASLEWLIALLRQWDGSYDHRQVGALAFEMLLAKTVANLGRARQVEPYQTIWQVQALIAEDLAQTDGAVLKRAVMRAADAVARRLPRYADWGAVHRIRLQHMLGGIPVLGRRYRLPDFPADGGNNTIHKTGHGLSDRPHNVIFGSCARHISDLADLDDNRFILLGGQDGWVGSANFADQVPLWRRGDYITVPLRSETIRACFPHRMVLRPAG
jgi:penicillin G amidase